MDAAVDVVRILHLDLVLGATKPVIHFVPRPIPGNTRIELRDEAQVGARVTVQEEGEDPVTYFFVGAKEAAPREGKISNESPIGRALIGHRAGESITVIRPNGSILLKIIAVE